MEKGGIQSSKHFILPTFYSPLRGGGLIGMILLESCIELLENAFLVRVVSTPASYSGSTGFKYQHKDRILWLRFLASFLSLPKQMRG